ncbi:MAG: 5S rRNA maturation endonuclease (ribonuclease M5) [Candidatus Nanohaloarchaea archaeon]|jgi:5S rRNA maturation endonuclease (ribonuclease M5)
MNHEPKHKDFHQLKQLERTVEKIDHDVDAAVVEGYSDKKALEKLGFTGRIFQSAERAVEELSEDIERSIDTVAILTDFDSHGKEASRELSQELEDKVNVDLAARKSFGKVLTSQDRYDVEDVAPLFSSWQDKFVEAALDRLYF